MRRPSSARTSQRLFGYEPREYLEGPGFWLDRVHPDDLPRILAEFPRLFELGRHAYEYRFRRKDGTYRWVSDELCLSRDESGEPLEVVGSWSDITERKQAEVALREQTASVELLQAVAVAANEATTADEAMRLCLERVCAHTGWPVGHVYALAGDGTGELVPTASGTSPIPSAWHRSARRPRRCASRSGAGLPGRVLASGRPVWIADVTQDPELPAREGRGRGRHQGRLRLSRAGRARGRRRPGVLRGRDSRAGRAAARPDGPRRHPARAGGRARAGRGRAAAGQGAGGGGEPGEEASSSPT